MEFIIIIIILVVLLLLIKTIYRINIKELKEIGENNKDLDDKVKKYPSNIEICKRILKKLNNESVMIKEDKGANNCLYIAISNKIIIANMRDSFTRIQTIAHECLHSVQDRRILLFNFFYSNFYFVFFYIVAILSALKFISNKMFVLAFFIILSFIFYFIRSYLENDAMIKARFLAKEYMKDEKISDEDEIEKIIKEYDKLNLIGIKTVNYGVLLNLIIRIIIVSLIFFIR